VLRPGWPPGPASRCWWSASGSGRAKASAVYARLIMP